MAKTVDRAIDRVSDARPLVERALRDQELREHVRDAFTAAREAYAELFGRTGVTGVAMKAATDREIQDNLRKAVEELRAAGDRLQGKDEHTTRNSILLLAGIGAAVLFNPITGPPIRRWLKTQFFGSGDEFTYAGSNGPGETAV
ncbi:MAG TPA: hypothetical protein VGQ15_09950 [Gaiellaceae bacterium]|jgi:hypothetical protein|nr:hypothetical protein [Gaiellaceae bacterium]